MGGRRVRPGPHPQRPRPGHHHGERRAHRVPLGLVQPHPLRGRGGLLLLLGWARRLRQGRRPPGVAQAYGHASHQHGAAGGPARRHDRQELRTLSAQPLPHGEGGGAVHAPARCGCLLQGGQGRGPRPVVRRGP